MSGSLYQLTIPPEFPTVIVFVTELKQSSESGEVGGEGEAIITILPMSVFASMAFGFV